MTTSERVPHSGGEARQEHSAAIVTKFSPGSVTGTLERLRRLVTEHGLTVFSVIDHSGAADAIGLRMPETKVLLFGNPASGTPVMLAAPLVALDLPLRVLLTAAPDGGCHVSFWSTEAFAARNGLDRELASRLDGVAALVDRVTSATRPIGGS